MYRPTHPKDSDIQFPLQVYLLQANGFWPLSERGKPRGTARELLEDFVRLFYPFLSWFVVIDILTVIYWEMKFLVSVFGNLILLTENMCSSFMGILVMTRMLHLLNENKRFSKIISLFIKDIWIPKGSHPHIELQCYNDMKPYRIMTFLMLFLISLYCIVPLVQAIGLGWESQEKPFPFRMLFDFDSQQRVPYIIVYLMSAYAGITVATTLIGEDAIIGMFMIYTCGQYRILHERIDNISKTALQRVSLENGLYDRRQLQKEYLRELNSIAYKQNLLMKFIEFFEGSINQIILVNFVLSTALLCFICFQLATDKNMIVVDYLKFGVYILSTLSQLFLLCYNGDRLIHIAAQTADHLYACNWEGDFVEEGNVTHLVPAAKEFRQHLQIMIMCSQRPVKITAGKFAPISLQTFQRLLSSSVSYFTLLQTVYKRGS